MAVFVFLASAAVQAQNVKLITVAQLENRFKQGKDTTFVVNFWATWCKPCVKELPAFTKLQSSTKGKKIKILLVSTDFKTKLESSVKPFVKAHQLNTEVFLLNENPGFAEKINKDWSGALPATLIVNTKGGKRKFNEGAYTYPQLLVAIN